MVSLRSMSIKLIRYVVEMSRRKKEVTNNNVIIGQLKCKKGSQARTIIEDLQLLLDIKLIRKILQYFLEKSEKKLNDEARGSAYKIVQNNLNKTTNIQRLLYTVKTHRCYIMNM